MGFNKYIDNGRVLLFDNGTIYTYHVNDPNNKVMLYQPQQSQPQQQVDSNQLFQNIMNNDLGGGFDPYPQPPITPNIITT